MKRIPLFGNRGKGQFALVDDEDLPKVSGIRWHLDHYGYARWHDTKEDKAVFMHHLVHGKPHKGIVDHINRNKLDNRKENLRTTDCTTNNFNKDIQKNNSTGYRGVYHEPSLKWKARYVAKIQAYKKVYFIGAFHTPEEASFAYELKRKEFYA